VKVGRPIIVGDVLSKSAKILSSRPILIAPQLIILIPNLINALLTSSSIFNPLGVLIGLIVAVLGVIVIGAYPQLVKAALEGGKLSVGEALGKAAQRFWTLVLAGILVVLIVGAGFIALVVPGIILLTWYAYTVPAIMLEGRGATERMAASKAFGRDKKGSTFLIFLTAGLVGLVLLGIESILSLASRTLGQIVFSILDVPLAAWVAVMVTYTYITYGPSSPAAMAGAPGIESTLDPSLQPSAMPSAPVSAVNNFCRFCGSALRADSKFCPNCGKPV
jgi:hypothetical protein